MWSVCLYNIWVLVSLVVAIIFHIDLKKPLVTAKLFGAVLYSSAPRGITRLSVSSINLRLRI